ncbi:MAG: hypothetical protein K2X47_11855, partial [Bdellovibrionales bacterium]|nr:hypothetical protein [Bdellovibrionales bacterium]
LAFFGHVLGVILTVAANGYASLFLATLLIGLSNGMVEAVTNPLVANLFPYSKTKMLNVLHAWWPAGLIAGGLMGFGLTKFLGLDDPGTPVETLRLGWKIKMGLVLLPTFAYGFLFWRQPFPQSEASAAGVPVREMFKEAARPMFLFFLFLMVLTVATELGPDQWIGNLLQNLVGIQGVLLLVYTAGIMFVLRNFLAGKLLTLLSPLGLLTIASVLSAIGLYGLSGSTTAGTIFVAATVFGLGKAFFWPTMVGVVAEKFPRGGAVLMGLIGGVGMLSAGMLVSPAIGKVQDHYAVEALSGTTRELVVRDGGIDETRVKDATDPIVLSEIEGAKRNSAVMTFKWLSLIPALLTVFFGGLYFSSRKTVASVQERLR